MKRRNILMIIFGVIALAINVLIIVESLKGGSSSSTSSYGFTQMIIDFIKWINPSSHIDENPEKVHAVVRKLFGHFLLFGASGIFTTLTIGMLDEATTTKKKEFIISSLMVGLTLAITSELIQIVVPERYGTPIDMLIDFSGYILFFAITFFILYIIQYKSEVTKK